MVTISGKTYGCRIRHLPWSSYCTPTLNIRREAVFWKPVAVSARVVKWELFIPLLLMVGRFGGFVTLGEEASIIVLYAFIVEVFVHRDIAIGQLPAIIRESMILVGAIFIIIGSALTLTTFMIDAEIPMKLFQIIQAHIHTKEGFLIALNLFLLNVGCLMDIYSALVVIVPIIVPIAMNYGINPVHLGIIFLANLEIGYFTPPVALNLFISSIRFNKTIWSLTIACVPFIILTIIALLVITYVPWMSLAFIEHFGIQ